MHHPYTNYGRPFRVHKRYLKLGESIRVSSFAKPFVSGDLSLGGEAIRRVQVSDTNFHYLIPPTRAEFVNLAQVEIACVPRDIEHQQERFRNLPEIPWQDDPPVVWEVPEAS